jgi:hypothetical protein
VRQACAPVAKRRPTQTCPPALRGQKIGGYTRSIDTSKSVIAIIGCVIAIVFFGAQWQFADNIGEWICDAWPIRGLQRTLPTDPRVIGGVIGSSE